MNYLIYYLLYYNLKLFWSRRHIEKNFLDPHKSTSPVQWHLYILAPFAKLPEHKIATKYRFSTPSVECEISTLRPRLKVINPNPSLESPEVTFQWTLFDKATKSELS